MTHSSTSSQDPAPSKWFRNVTERLWWCKFTPSHLNEIASVFRDGLPEETHNELVVECTHIQPFYKGQKKTISGNKRVREERILHHTITQQPITQELEKIYRRIYPTDDGNDQPPLHHLLLRCSAREHVFELRIGSHNGYARQRVTIYASWPGSDPWPTVKTIRDRILKRNRIRRVFIATVALVALDLVGTTLALYIPYINMRFQAPGVNHAELFGNLIAAPAFWVLIVVLFLWVKWDDTVSSRVAFGPGKLAKKVAKWRSAVATALGHVPIFRRWIEAARRQTGVSIDLAALGVGALGVIVGLLSLIVGVLTWLSPR